MDKIVGRVYKLKKQLGAGSFGTIYLVEHIKTKEQFAAKLEPSDAGVPQLRFEAKLYKYFAGGEHIPQMHWYGSSPTHNVMVMDLLGKSLQDNFTKCGSHLSIKTVLMLADQMLEAIQYLHEKNYIHRDIKPDNFVMGSGHNAKKVFVIDYGLSKKYRDTTSHKHIKYTEGKSLTGTARYASIGALRGHEQSRRDDLEALGYVWVYLIKGKLPWMGIDAKTREEKYRKIADSKERHYFDVCNGLPPEFLEYFQAVRALRFEEEPDYDSLRDLFSFAFSRYGYEKDYIYDWTEPKKPAPRTSRIGRENVLPNEVSINKRYDRTNIHPIERPVEHVTAKKEPIIERSYERQYDLGRREHTVRRIDQTQKRIRPIVKEERQRPETAEKRRIARNVEVEPRVYDREKLARRGYRTNREATVLSGIPKRFLV